MKPFLIYELQAELCKAFGHPTRLEIIHLLRGGPKRVGDLAQTIGGSPVNVSRHLAVLRNNQILAVHHRGRDTFYSIVDPRISDLCDLMRQVLIDQATRGTQAFGSFLE